MSAKNDQRKIRTHYATDEYVRIRQEIHEKYTHPRIDFANWVLSNLQWKGGERVLDVGCGNGTYYYPLQYQAPASAENAIEYYGMDISLGILNAHPAVHTGHLIVGDALKLPFANGSFDVVMANHMMFYLEDIDNAIVEFKRILKPDGVLLIATNSMHSMPQLTMLLKRAIVLLSRMGSSMQSISAPSDAFSLEAGIKWLSRYFYAVMRSDLPSTLVFDELEPIMSYLESSRDLREPFLPSDVHWDDVMLIMRQQITHLINYSGQLPVDKLSGVLVATDNGDFISEFLTQQAKSAGS